MKIRGLISGSVAAELWGAPGKPAFPEAAGRGRMPVQDRLGAPGQMRAALIAMAAALTVFSGAASSQTRIDLKTQTKSVDFSGASATAPSKAGTTLPASCAAGQTFVKTDGPLGQNWYICTAAGQWSLQGFAIPSLTGNAGGVLATDGSTTFWKLFGGDVSGTADALTVNRIGGRSLSLTAPVTGQVLGWSGTQWAPQTPALSTVFGRTGTVTAQTGDYTFAQIGGTVATTQLPAAGGDLSGTLTAASVAKLQGFPLAATTPTTGQVLTWSGTQWAPQAGGGGTGAVSNVFGRTGAVTGQTGDYTFSQIGGTVATVQLPAEGGDLSGTLGAATVVKLQGRTMAATAPTTGQVLTWSGTQWAPQAAAGGGAVSSIFGRTGAVTGQTGDYTFSQIGGTVASGQLPAAGGDLSGTLGAATVAKLQGSAVAATVPTTGQVLTWSGTQWAPQASGGAVSSVFGRTGTVAPQTGDYTFSQIGGTVGASQLPAPGGDLTGTVTSASVTAIQGRAVGTTPPSTGQVLAWNGSQWKPQAMSVAPSNYSATFTGQTSVTMLGTLHRLGTANLIVQCYDNANPANEVEPSGVTVNPISFDVTVMFATAQSGGCVVSGGGGVGGGGGATMGAQLGDFSVTRTDATTLTIGAGCGVATPCNARIGSQVYSITGSATASLTAGTGMAFVYLDVNGALTVGHSMTATCSGTCVTASGITNFPVNAVPLFTWTATNGFWDAGGGLDRRSWLNATNFASGPGIVTIQAAGQTTVSVDSATVPTYLTGSATLDFPSIAAGTCSTDLTIPVAGANAGDAVVAGWPGRAGGGLDGSDASERGRSGFGKAMRGGRSRGQSGERNFPSGYSAELLRR